MVGRLATSACAGQRTSGEASGWVWWSSNRADWNPVTWILSRFLTLNQKYFVNQLIYQSVCANYFNTLKSHQSHTPTLYFLRTLHMMPSQQRWYLS